MKVTADRIEDAGRKGGKKKTALNQPDDTKSLSASDTQRQYKRGFSLKKKKKTKENQQLWSSSLLSSPLLTPHSDSQGTHIGWVLFCFSFLSFFFSLQVTLQPPDTFFISPPAFLILSLLIRFPNNSLHPFVSIGVYYFVAAVVTLSPGQS